jgi:hypothetical protein
MPPAFIGIHRKFGETTSMVGEHRSDYKASLFFFTNASARGVASRIGRQRTARHARRMRGGGSRRAAKILSNFWRARFCARAIGFAAGVPFWLAVGDRGAAEGGQSSHARGSFVPAGGRRAPPRHFATLRVALRWLVKSSYERLPPFLLHSRRFAERAPEEAAERAPEPKFAASLAECEARNGVECRARSDCGAERRLIASNAS